MRNRKAYICYSPNYVPGIGKHKTVKTKLAMKRLLRKWGSGSEATTVFLIKHRMDSPHCAGGLSFWNTKDGVEDWVYTKTEEVK